MYMNDVKYLAPSDLEEIPVFTNWDPPIEQTVYNDFKINMLEGNIEHVGCTEGTSSFAKLLSIVSRDEIASILELVKKKNAEFKTDPDSVDGMSTHEIYVDMNNSEGELEKKITEIIDSRITPYVRYRYPQKNDRLCTPSQCLIRRYRDDERKVHLTHRDGHAYATVVISLSDYGTDYKGGIYVASAERYKKIVPLHKGDAVVHKHDLLHGVKVYDNGGERWSWIIWFKDSIRNVDHNIEWYKEKAHAGIPVYQSLYANALNDKDRIFWLNKAAEQGHANSMVKLARAHMKTLGSDYVQYDLEKAYKLYRKAIETSQEPDAQYEIVQLILMKPTTFEFLSEVIDLLQKSAQGGHLYAMFNLGIAHLYGYTGKQNTKLAAEWFEASQIPEGLIAASMFYDSIQDNNCANKLRLRASKLGYGTPWRKRARICTGLGGASGVDINLPWPTLPNGLKPDIW